MFGKYISKKKGPFSDIKSSLIVSLVSGRGVFLGKLVLHSNFLFFILLAVDFMIFFKVRPSLLGSIPLGSFLSNPSSVLSPKPIHRYPDTCFSSFLLLPFDLFPV